MDTFKKTNYHKTKTACYMGFITQAVTANFAPLLFLNFTVNIILILAILL